LKQGVLFNRAKYVVEEEVGELPLPSIRICVSQAHTQDQLEKAAIVLKQSITKLLNE